MRALAALVPFALLLAGPAGAVGAGSLGEMDTVTIHPRGAPVAAEADTTRGERVSPDAQVETDSSLAVPAPATELSLRRTPYEAPHGYARSSVGNEGRLATTDSSTWQADLEADTPAPILYGKDIVPSGRPPSLHLGVNARGERLVEAREARLERALAPSFGLSRAATNLGAPQLAMPSAGRAQALDYHAPAPVTLAAAGAAHAPTPPGAAATLATQVAGAATTSWAHVATVAAGAALLILLPWTLYHRLRGAKVLDQGTRARLYQLLQAKPGLAAVDLARALDVDATTARYHLDRLVREGLAVTEGSRRALRYFAAGSVAPELRSRHVAAREGREVLDAVRAAPGATKGALAAALAIARPTLAWHLGRLERAGLVRCERAGREARVYPDEEALASLAASAGSAQPT